QVGTPATVLSLFIDHDVLAQRRCSNSLARRMLPSVPGGTVSLCLPATTIRCGRSGWAQTSCAPRWRTMLQPASDKAPRTSRYFLATRSRYGSYRTPVRLPLDRPATAMDVAQTSRRRG